jgi:hypothetical protein
MASPDCEARKDMADNRNEQPETSPVYVIESIPVEGDHLLTREEMAAEGVPAPAHLRICPELARGGMGRIHAATDRNLLRHVALKRLDMQLAEVPMYRDGFIAEAQMTGQLEHPNIVPVHELSISEQGVPYFTMKLVQGVSFDAWMRDPSRALGTTERLHEGLDIFIKVCDAVAYAHHRGVIHRDIKPENIMVAEFGQVYLMDWGLARLTKSRPASGSHSQMEAPGPVGTAPFMAPEQARGNPADMDERSDIFGLGAVLYELVSGNVISLDKRAAGLGVAKILRNIVNRAVAPNPEDRYQSVVDLQADVRQFLRGGMYLPRQTFQPGSVIMREGDDGNTAYMLVSGHCRAYRVTREGQEDLATMGPGDVFGEMALLLEEPRSATVEAKDMVTVLVLDKKTMEEGLGIGGWTGSLVRALAQRFRALEQQVRISGIRRSVPAEPIDPGE